MFDFPASPAIGDVSNGYRWNGTGWAGGPVVGTPTEQIIDLSGKVTTDVVVPSWAKGVEITGVLFPTTTLQQSGLWLSFDGSTFINTGTPYQAGGPYHASADATPYKTQPAIAYSALQLSWATNNLAIPQHIDAVLNLTVGNTSQLFTLRSNCVQYDSVKGIQTETITSYYNVAEARPVKAFRIGNTTTSSPTAYGPNSWLRLRWIGSDIPQSNAITEAPSDGAEYVRVNGIWRKKSETFTWTASRSVAVFVCPPGATRLRAVAFVTNPSTPTLGSFGFQGSQDGGATWNTANGAYYYSGLLCDSLTAATASVGAQAATWGYLGWQTNNTSVPNHVTADIQLVRPAAGATWAWHSVGGGYHDGGGVGQRTWVVNGYLSTGWNTALPVNAIQFFNANSTMLAGSIECTWGYG